MLLGQQNQAVDEFSYTDFGCFLLVLWVFEEIFVDPNLPLWGLAYHDHILRGTKGAEFVNQDIVADHHFLEQIEYLGKRQQTNIRQPTLDIFNLNPYLADTLLLSWGVHLRGRAVCGLPLERFIGHMAAEWRSGQVGIFGRGRRIVSQGVLHRFDDGQGSFETPGQDLYLAMDQRWWDVEQTYVGVSFGLLLECGVRMQEKGDGMFDIVIDSLPVGNLTHINEIRINLLYVVERNS